jgi:S1-C subfamily serine protease
MRRIVSFGPAFVVLLTAAAVMVAVPGVLSRLDAGHTRAAVNAARLELDQDPLLEQLNLAVRRIAQAVEPSVVHIDVSQDQPWGGRFSSGSGWVYDDLGHLVTNAHVVATADVIRVQFADSRVTQATMVGMDLAADIAVLRVEPGPHLIPMRRDTGGRVRKGDRVYAFGSPFNFKFSMSEGVVSGLGRSARTATGFVSPANFIQTDAAINPGNSGGPLVDIRGKLVGMNVAIATAQDTQGATEGQSAGISFAIPLSMVESRVQQILEGAPPLGGFIGILFGPDDDGRIRISRVVPDSPASAAGVEPGDVIVGAADQHLRDADELRAITSALRPGAVLPLRVLRDGKTLDLSITLGAMTPQRAARQYLDVVQSEIGVALRDTGEGPAVAFVVPGSMGAAAGLRPGQRLLRVAGREVDSAAAAAELLVGSGVILGRPVQVEVMDPEDPAPKALVISGR